MTDTLNMLIEKIRSDAPDQIGRELHQYWEGYYDAGIKIIQLIEELKNIGDMV